MKTLVAAALLSAFAMPASALEGGSYAVGPQIFNPEVATPRYVHLDVDGNTIKATFIALYQPDAQMCADTGMCDPVWDGLVMQTNGTRIVSHEVLREDKVSDFPMADNYLNYDEALYFAPLMKAIDRNADDIVPLSYENLMRSIALVLNADVASRSLNGCELTQMSEIERSGGNDEFYSALDYYRALSDMLNLSRRYGPTFEMSEEDFKIAREVAAPYSRAASVMGLALTFVATAEEGEDGLAKSSEMADRILDGSFQTFDDIMAPVIDDLPAAAKLFANIAETYETMDLPEAVCADMTFGL
ncbi:hypothetical protein HCZ30_04025 [Marivivens donghaensis]|uniref:Uncharacterized protein n=1 Tax=Marivivens donghaensis TaxID=1699413 RepID=A0ABX0VUY3_9RHOB|nr:hypothetical protein [Marivivens donghaensis]NIY71599.1 hypothetical protein [Marivivens donghaensis]